MVLHPIKTLESCGLTITLTPRTYGSFASICSPTDFFAWLTGESENTSNSSPLMLLGDIVASGFQRRTRKRELFGLCIRRLVWV